MKRIMAAWCCICVLTALTGITNAQAYAEESSCAVDIMDASLIRDDTGFESLFYLYDKKEEWGVTRHEACSLTLEYPEGIGSLYTIFFAPYERYLITDSATGQAYIREDPFLHDYVNLVEAFGYAPESVTVTFPAGDLSISELYVYSAGQVPDSVQQWKPPAEKETDLILFTTHCDDEQLFFAGILPYYAGELDYRVQVVYLTDHHNNLGATRLREALNGLWAVGVDTYPVFGSFPDFLQENIQDAYYQFERMGYPKDTLVGFVTEQLRRFRPKVVVGHDFAGEYGHGQHMVYADAVAEAVKISMDASRFPETAEKYGLWDVPKTYIHLYAENEIEMDWDRPLKAFDGRTAFEASIQLGFAQHKSQIRDFQWYYRGSDTAAEIPRYSPCLYGLYRSTVGEDLEKNDFFEHVTTYAMDAQIAQELQQEEETVPPEPTQEAAEEQVPDQTEPPVREAPPAPSKNNSIWVILLAACAIVAGLALRKRPVSNHM